MTQIKFYNPIDRTNKHLVQNRIFKSRKAAMDFVKKDKDHRMLRDMNDPTTISMGMRWQVMVFEEDQQKKVPQQEAQTPSPSQTKNNQPAKKHIPKTEIVRQLMKEMYGKDGIRPKDIINAIMEKANMKRRAASTYYYNAKEELGLK